MNRTVKTMISQYVRKNRKSWDEHLPALQFAYNTAVHDATGYTLAYLNDGRELTRPLTQETQETDEPDAVAERLQDAYKLVQVKLARAFEKQQYDLR